MLLCVIVLQLHFMYYMHVIICCCALRRANISSSKFCFSTLDVFHKKKRTNQCSPISRKSGHSIPVLIFINHNIPSQTIHKHAKRTEKTVLDKKLNTRERHQLPLPKLLISSINRNKANSLVVHKRTRDKLSNLKFVNWG